MQNLDLVFHHTGIAVASIEEVKASYQAMFHNTSFSQVFEVTSQKVRVCFLEVGPNVFLEFVEPSGEDSSIHRFLKKGISTYHTAYTTKDIELAVNTLEAKDYRGLGYFSSEAFNNNRCIFLISPEGHLIELIEQ